MKLAAGDGMGTCAEDDDGEGAGRNEGDGTCSGFAGELAAKRLPGDCAWTWSIDGDGLTWGACDWDPKDGGEANENDGFGEAP